MFLYTNLLVHGWEPLTGGKKDEMVVTIQQKIQVGVAESVDIKDEHGNATGASTSTTGKTTDSTPSTTSTTTSTSRTEKTTQTEDFSKMEPLLQGHAQKELEFNEAQVNLADRMAHRKAMSELACRNKERIDQLVSSATFEELLHYHEDLYQGIS